MAALADESRRLLIASSASATWKSYKTGLHAFDCFRHEHSLTHLWPVPISHLVLFISFLSLSGLAVNTAKSYLAAISSLHKIKNLTSSCSHFIILKMLEGFRRNTPLQTRARAPITFPLLVQISGVLSGVCNSSYEVSLFNAAFSLAFFGFLRISEFALATKSTSSIRVLQLSDLSLYDSTPPVIEVKVRFSKTDQLGRGTTLRILADTNTIVCPFALLRSYIAQRGIHNGPLFCHFDKSPLTRFQVQSVLRKSLLILGQQCSNFSTHSFRIGSATSAAANKVPEDILKVMGRWRSNAYQSYIRIPCHDIICSILT